MNKLILSLILTALTAPAFADCPARSPNLKWNVHSADQTVDAAFLGKTLVGKRVRYNFGGVKSTESYQSDGGYTYKDGSGTYAPKGYTFYSNGVRCLDYPRGPRFDRYVVANNKLILINQQGGRFEGKILK